MLVQKEDKKDDLNKSINLEVNKIITMFKSYN